jgi:hypothetical protein
MKEISSLKRHIEESPKLRDLKRKRHQKRVRFWVFVGIIFVLLVTGFIIASRAPRILIQNITVSGNQVVDTKDITDRVQSYLAGNYAYVIPRRNIFLFPKKKILADLAETFPRLRNISIKKTSLTAIAISVSELKGNALWCGMGTEKIDPSVQCYFTDTSGVIISQAPYYSGNVYTRFFGSTLLTSDQSPLGQMFIPADSFAKLLAFGEQVKSLGFSIKSIHISAGGEEAIVIDTGSGHTAPIRFLSDANYAILGANLASALGKKELADMVKTNLSKLEYFDLRFTNKVYYKFSP